MIEQVHEILNALKRPATLEDIAGRAQCSMEDAANALQSLMRTAIVWRRRARQPKIRPHR